VSDSIRVLVVEDNPLDAELVLEQLRRAGFVLESHRVETEGEFLRFLDEAPDIILSDASLPKFDGLRALDLLQERGLDIPFVLVSAQMGEELAVDAMKRGAYDYIVKDRLGRLGEAVKSALERKRLRQERAWAMEALRLSEERYRLISEVTSDYAYSLQVETDGRLTCEWITDALASVTGFTLDEVNQRGWQSLSYPGDAAIMRQHYEVLLSGESHVFEVRIAGKDGRIRWVRFSERPILDREHGRVVRIYGAAQDITQRRDLEQQLRHSQKMEAIGRLAGGLAHDFNNLLTVIAVCGEMLEEGFASGNPGHEHLKAILHAGERAAQLTQQLLAFSRRQVLQAKPANLNVIVADLEKMLHRVIGEDVELRAIFGQELGMVKVDPSQIEQVILNLVINARDAMPNGGRLTIETANIEMEEAYAAEHALIPAGTYVMLAVSDTGTGMDKETQARIFEPFFTTKGVGKGTGLGLSTAYGIINQSGGDIWVYSSPDHGTTFRIYLPKLQAVEAESRKEAAPSASVAGSETILVVEDESVVLDLVRHALSRQGYTVLAASGVEEALRLSQEHPGEIALLLTDMVMPGMRGLQLAEQVVRMRKGIKVLYMSGYPDTPVDQLAPAAALLEKPFKPSALARKVRDALDAPCAVSCQSA
jgi:two-component system cell cycle sensor histidine kinase/response regulator CckA